MNNESWRFAAIVFPAKAGIHQTSQALMLTPKYDSYLYFSVCSVCLIFLQRRENSISIAKFILIGLEFDAGAVTVGAGLIEIGARLALFGF